MTDENNSSQQPKDDNYEKDAVALLNHIVELSKFSYDMEEKREQSLIQQTGQMIMSFSIISVAEFMLLPIVLQYIHHLSRAYIFTWCGIITIPLLAMLILKVT